MEEMSSSDIVEKGSEFDKSIRLNLLRLRAALMRSGFKGRMTTIEFPAEWWDGFVNHSDLSAMLVPHDDGSYSALGFRFRFV